MTVSKPSSISEAEPPLITPTATVDYQRDRSQIIPVSTNPNGAHSNRALSAMKRASIFLVR
jgi:hypothetical protein